MTTMPTVIPIRSTSLFSAVAIAIVAFALGGCGSEAEGGPSTTTDTSGGGQGGGGHSAVGWTEESHGNSVDANYDVVFAQGTVQRLDIVIAAEDLAAMLADVDDYVEEQEGGGGPPVGPPPPQAIAACQDADEDDACQYQYEGDTVEGTCLPDPHQPRLICVNMGAPGASDRDPIYVPCTLWYDEKSWPQVGIRYKGNSSLRFSWEQGVRKLPFRLELDEYEDQYPDTKNQRFYGFQELTFAPGYFDASYLHDALANEVFNDLGVPAPRTAFWAVYVDEGDGVPQYWGLYTMIEDPTDAMMTTVYGDDSGNMYKPERGCADWTCASEDGFVKKNNEDEDDYSDVAAAVTALLADRSDAEAWRTGLEATFDAAGFLRWLAVSTFIVNWDSYGMTPHNYYLYGVPSQSGRLVWIPWDHNMSLDYYPRGNLTLALDEVEDSWPLIRYLLDDPVYAAIYYEELERALDGPLEVQAFSARAQELHDLISPYAEQEQEPYTQLSSWQAFESSVSGPDGLVAHVEERRAAVVELLGLE